MTVYFQKMATHAKQNREWQVNQGDYSKIKNKLPTFISNAKRQSVIQNITYVDIDILI